MGPALFCLDQSMPVYWAEERQVWLERFYITWKQPIWGVLAAAPSHPTSAPPRSEEIIEHKGRESLNIWELVGLGHFFFPSLGPISLSEWEFIVGPGGPKGARVYPRGKEAESAGFGFA